MVSLKLIDKIKIGNIKFEAHILEDENKLEAFGVYFQSESEPILLFQQDTINEVVNININTILVDKMQTLKSKSKALRKEHFKKFQEFVLNSEQVAKEMVFEDKKLNYITDVHLMKSIEKAFLIG